MISRIIYIEHYWKVIVYYDIDYNFFDYIEETIRSISTPVEDIDDVYFSLLTTAKAFTISNTKSHISIVGFNKHIDIFDYLNSIIHESEHIKDAMLYSYNVENYGEPPAYTIAYIATKLIQNSNLLNYIK